MTRDLTGTVFEADVGKVAQGGHCVARYDGRVVFVRHALPGEHVRVQVTRGKEGDRFLFGDAIDVLAASSHRVVPRCRFSGPGGCGGCDWQHAEVGYQRELKAAVVREQLQRLSGLDAGGDLELCVEALPGDAEGTRWRTRVEFAVDAAGRPGLRRRHSHHVVPVDDCLIATERIIESGVLQRRWPGSTSVDVVAASGSRAAVVVAVPGDEAPDVVEKVTTGDWSADFHVGARGFWQAHPGAAATFVAHVLAELAPEPGEAALDLYAGVGLFARALADSVGPAGAVLAVESDARAVGHAKRNLRHHPQVEVRRATVERTLRLLVQQRIAADLVVLDPPRAGAGKAVIRDVAALHPRAVAYVGCDPAALARDLRYAQDLGYGVRSVRGFDAFPMTHHVECIAILQRRGS